MKKEQEPLLCKQVDIAKVCGMKPHNISTTYIGKEHKQSMLKAMDIGTFCIMNNITNGELKVFVSLSAEIKKQLIEKMKEVTL